MMASASSFRRTSNTFQSLYRLVGPGWVPTSRRMHTLGCRIGPNALKNQRCELIFFALRAGAGRGKGQFDVSLNLHLQQVSVERPTSFPVAQKKKGSVQLVRQGSVQLVWSSRLLTTTTRGLQRLKKSLDLTLRQKMTASTARDCEVSLASRDSPRHGLTLHGYDPPLCRFELEFRVDRDCESGGRRRAKTGIQLLSPPLAEAVAQGHQRKKQRQQQQQPNSLWVVYS